jgi:hypothetical protein
MDQSGVRRGVAELLGVTVSPDDENPWDLPVSPNSSDWGVSGPTATERFGLLQKFLGAEPDLVLNIIGLNEIAFEMYEDAVTGPVRAGGVVAMAFDYSVLVRDRAPAISRRRGARHVARLSPVGDELADEPNILSPEFVLDYSGLLRIFDDSCEMSYEESLVNWRLLLDAGWSINGTFWIVERAR